MCHSCLDIAHCKALKNYQQSDSQSLCASTKVVCGKIKKSASEFMYLADYQ